MQSAHSLKKVDGIDSIAKVTVPLGNGALPILRELVQSVPEIEGRNESYFQANAISYISLIAMEVGTPKEARLWINQALESALKVEGFSF